MYNHFKRPLSNQRYQVISDHLPLMLFQRELKRSRMLCWIKCHPLIRCCRSIELKLWLKLLQYGSRVKREERATRYYWRSFSCLQKSTSYVTIYTQHVWHSYRDSQMRIDKRDFCRRSNECNWRPEGLWTVRLHHTETPGSNPLLLFMVTKVAYLSIQKVECSSKVTQRKSQAVALLMQTSNRVNRNSYRNSRNTGITFLISLLLAIHDFSALLNID